jgi:hypothetical protein
MMNQVGTVLPWDQAKQQLQRKMRRRQLGPTYNASAPCTRLENNVDIRVTQGNPDVYTYPQTTNIAITII